MNNEFNYSSFALIRDLFTFAKPFKWRFIWASVIRIASDISWLYSAYALASITTFFSTYKTGESLDEFWRIVVTFGIVIIFHFTAIYFGNMLGYKLAKKTAIQTELLTMRHAFSLDIEWHERENTGNKVKRIGRGAEGVNQLIRMWFNSFIEVGVSIFGVFIVMSHFDKPITLATIAFFAVYLLVSFFFTTRAVKAQKSEHLKEEEVSGLVFESVNNVRSAKVMSMVNPLISRLTIFCNDLVSLAYKRMFWYLSGGVVKNLMGHIFRLGVVAYIGVGIMHGRYDIGFIVLFYSYFSNVLAAISRLADISQTFATHKQSVARMMELLQTKPVTDIEEGKVMFPKDWKNIEVKNLSFSYGDKKILEDVSFTISRGEKIGIVGLSGAGKSTLFKLLLKERESYTGDILVDGVPLKTISKIDYFKHTAVVLQDTEVFNLTLKDNITISNIDKLTDEGLLERALTVAHVNGFAKLLPQGINTLIGEKGVKLSGGEKQRVGLARAIYKEPELLLLDEATSHLDIESEEKIQDSLHHFFKTVTAVVIAHRLSTIKEMDKILMIEDGKIIEHGSFDELHKMRGRFYTLWEKQKL